MLVYFWDTISVRARHLRSLRKPSFSMNVHDFIIQNKMILDIFLNLFVTSFSIDFLINFCIDSPYLLVPLGIKFHVFGKYLFDDLGDRTFIDLDQKWLPWIIPEAPPFSLLFRSCPTGGVFEGSLAHVGSLLAACWLHVGRFGCPFGSILKLLTIQILTFGTLGKRIPPTQRPIRAHNQAWRDFLNTLACFTPHIHILRSLRNMCDASGVLSIQRSTSG